MTKSIPLSQGKVALVDDEDFEYLNQWKWYLDCGYARRSVHCGKEVTRRHMHREILSVPDGLVVDHINRNKTDNRKCNLRVCSTFENQRNKDKQNNNTSGFKGVSFHSFSRKWRARIQVNNGTIYLGYFDDVEKAARAYDIAAKKYHEGFAVLNFPEE